MELTTDKLGDVTKFIATNEDNLDLCDLTVKKRGGLYRVEFYSNSEPSI